MLGDIVEGAARFGASYIGGKKRLARREEAQGAYDQSMQQYLAQDTSNLYANLENTMEDLTVNTQAADFAAQQQAQGLSNIMGSMNRAAGGSGIAALAQSLANQQAQSAQQASTSIGQQESMNQRLTAQEAGRLQTRERMGAEQSRGLKAQLLGEEFQIDANELASSEEAIQAARAARTEGIGQFAGGVGNAIGEMGISGPSTVFGKLGEGEHEEAISCQTTAVIIKKLLEMAKQQGSGVVAAARRVSDVQGRFQDIGDQFMTGYDKAMESKAKMEARNEELQAKTNAYIDQFEGDVDLADFSDEDKSLVKSQVISYRNEYIEGANGAAKIKDKASPEYQIYIDKMNAAQNKMERLRDNLEGVANLKIEYANNFKAGGVYSNSQKNSENLLRANAILESNISGIGDDGSLNFKGYSIPMPGGSSMAIDNFSYNTKNFKKPFGVATDEANAILGLATREENAKSQVTENQEKIIRSSVSNILSNNEVLYSILSNSELQLIPLNSIDPDDPNAREQAVDMLTQAIKDSRGAGLIEEPGDPNKDTRTTAQKNDEAERQKIKGYLNSDTATFTSDGYRFENKGDVWHVFDEDNVSVITSNNKQQQVRSLEDIYAFLGL